MDDLPGALLRLIRSRRDGTWDSPLVHARTNAVAVGKVAWEVRIDSTVVHTHQHAAKAQRRWRSGRARVSDRRGARPQLGCVDDHSGARRAGDRACRVSFGGRVVAAVVTLAEHHSSRRSPSDASQRGVTSHTPCQRRQTVIPRDGPYAINSATRDLPAKPVSPQTMLEGKAPNSL